MTVTPPPIYMELEDGSGYWLFEDDKIILWSGVEGNPLRATQMLFRDKRSEMSFRDKRTVTPFTEKRTFMPFGDKRALSEFRDKRTYSEKKE